MSNTKNINIQLRRDKESELKVIEFLEDKPAKFIIVEALEMYMKAYTAMKEGQRVVGVSEDVKTEPNETKKLSSSARKLGNMG